MFPNIHHKHGLEARNIADFMERDPVIRATRCWDFYSSLPTHTAHPADTRKVSFQIA
jgi:hypothetical protein